MIKAVVIIIIMTIKETITIATMKKKKAIKMSKLMTKNNTMIKKLRRL